MSLPLTLGGRRLKSFWLCYGPKSGLYIHVLPHVCNNGKTYDEPNYFRSFSNMFENEWFVENNFIFELSDNWENILKKHWICCFCRLGEDDNLKHMKASP